MEHYGDSAIMNKQNDLFPPEIVNAMTCLAVDTRQIIFSALLNNHELSFTEIEKLGITAGNLTSHLPIMMKAGLVEKHIRSNSQAPFYSFYSVTQFGKDFIKGIFESMKPIEEKPKVYARSTNADISFTELLTKLAGIKEIKTPSSSGIFEEVHVP